MFANLMLIFMHYACHLGLKLIKTETIERIHESEEGSMQNVGMLYLVACSTYMCNYAVFD